MARGFKVADAYVELTIDRDELARGVKDIPRTVGPDMDRAGKDMGKRLGKSLGDESSRQGDDAGGKLALGMRMSIIRNSPLIVAAVAGALAVGAPAMMTAATGLFAGIGIVAAAQSDKVQKAWVGTWNQVKDAAIADARVIEPVLVKMAGAVGASFERMRPLVRDAFAAAAPQIEVFTRGITDLAENALPGMVRAVENGMPVTQGFADFLAKVGGGLGEFFTRISQHGPAAGAVWSSLGDVMAELLPILGELLGQGAELAATVLPMLAGALGLVLNVVDSLGPLLPVIVAGFTAMKIVGAVSPMLATLSTNLATAAANGGLMSGVAGKMSTAVGGLSAAVGPLSVGIAAWAGIFQYSEAQISKWTAALNEGGDAAAKAKQDMAGYDEGIGRIGTVLDTTAAKTNIFTASTAWAWEKLSNDTDEARQAHEDYLASLTPVEAAQRQVGIATDYLATQIEKYGAGSNEAEGASRALKGAQGELEQQNADLEMAIQGVTQAMLDQAAQARGAIDADFAYENSLDQLEDKARAFAEAQAHLNDRNKDSRTTLEDVSDAQRDYAEGIWNTAQKAAEAAPMLDGLEQGTASYQRAVDNLTLKSLVDMRAGLGPEMQVVVDGMIAKLQQGGASLDELGQKKPKPVVDADTAPLNLKTADAKKALDIINGLRPFPLVRVNDQATPTARSIIEQLGKIQSKTVTITTIHKAINKVGAAVGGAWGFASGGKPSAVIRGFDGGGTPQRRSDGKLVGPGGPLDDLIPAITNLGEHIRVANDEWIVPGAVGYRQGDRKMAALVAGEADIVPRRFDRGGPIGERGGAGSANTYNVNLHMHGTDFSNPRDRRLIVSQVVEGIREFERSVR